MKNTMKKLLSLLLVAVMLFGNAVFSSGTVYSNAATTYPSNQTLVYDLENMSGKYGVFTIGGFFEILSSISHFEFYSGSQCVASNVKVTDFPYYSSYCITKVIFKIDATYIYDPNNPGGNGGDLTLNFDISEANYRNISTEFDIFIRDLDSQPKLYTYTKEIPVSVYNGLVQSGPVFPAGYDSTRDVWSFKNPTNKIPAKYWTWLCSEVQAKEYEKDSGSGMCFGMSATAINLNSAFQTSYDFSKNSIYDISKNDNSNSLEISALKYIAYMQTSQINSLICDEEKKHSNNLQALYDAVYEYQTKGSKNSVGVNISISGRYFGEAHHSIMGIKVEDYSDRAEILVYDSNHPTKNKYLILKKDANGNFVSWQYELFSGLITVLWGTEFKDSEISFSTQSEVAYAALYGYLKGESLTEQDVNFFNNKYNLVKTKNASINNNDKLLKIKWSNIRIDDNITGDPASDIYMDDNYQYYWTSEDNIVFTAKGENASCKLLAQNTGISIDSFSGSTVELYGKENKLIANTTNGSEFTTTFISCDNPNSYVTATISGITSKETVTATQTETGLLVTGISDGTVTLSKDEEVIATKTVTDAISDIEITYDKTGADTSVELEYEQAECEHDDTDGDGKCDACGAPVATPPAPETPDTPADDDNSCSCICHSENSIVQFFYVIFRFLWQLFGMNMDCACGVKHFDFYIFS